ncbi:polysaccharide biosynthesis C-terminal domain-containing protein [Candidatus Kuenenbacteria bacterium]|nr:polysaccharide biosynthesis C-terminal domain-containing protein [Candidatus Kuenenbacteria bacterium]
MRDDSIKKRYFYKLVVRIIGLVFYLARVTIVPRALGPADFGSFTFLERFFSSIINFFDFGSSSAFFNYNSKNKSSGPIILFYSIFSFCLPLVLSLFILIVWLLGFSELFWPEQQAVYIYAGAGFAWLLWLSNLIYGFSDSKGMTVVSEIVRLKVRFITIFLLVGLFTFKFLNLATFYVYSYIELIGLIGFVAYFLWKNKLFKEYNLKNLKQEFRKLWTYFRKFCSPMVAYSIVVLVAGLFGAWFLQKIYGSVEYGYFGLSVKIGSFCMIFTGSMIPIFMKEFSQAHGVGDYGKMKKLFYENSRLLYFLAVLLSVYFAFFAKEISSVLAGKEFVFATIPVAIMSFYPAYQTYAQINSTAFYSTERTKIYRNIGISIIGLGLIMQYIFIAPRHFIIPGLELGAIGAAIATLTTLIICTHIQLYFNCKYLKLKFLNFLKHQISVLILLSVLMVTIKYLTSQSFAYLNIQISIYSTLTTMALAGVLYLAIAIVIIYIIPNSMIGLSKEKINSYKEIILSKMKNKLFSK